MNEQTYENLIKPIIEIYSQIELDLLTNIANRFDTYDTVGGSLDWYLKKLEDMGALTKQNLKIISDKSKLTRIEIKRLMEDAGYNITHLPDYKKAFDKDIIDISPDELYNSQAIKNIMREAIKDTNDIMKLINTKALESARKAYMDILNKAYIEVSSGIYSYQESIKKALIEMANKGIGGATYMRQGKIIEYSLEGTVRRDVLTKTRQTANSVSLGIEEELDEDLVYVSQHYGARPSHAIWQGKVYSRSGSNKNYPSLVKETGYGTITGLGGVNCRHFIMSYIEGITKIPTRADVAKNERIYDLTQEQRAYERKVRADKKQLAVAKTEEEKKAIKEELKTSTDNLNSFVNKHSELRRDYSRTQITEDYRR